MVSKVQIRQEIAPEIRNMQNLRKITSPSFPLTTTMVKSKNPIKSTAISAHPPGPQAISPSVGEFPDLLNLISWPSSRTRKCAHPRGCSRMCNTVRCSSRSVSASENSRQTSPEPSSSSEEKESGEKEVDLDSKTPTTSRVLASKLSHRIVPL